MNLLLDIAEFFFRTPWLPPQTFVLFPKWSSLLKRVGVCYRPYYELSANHRTTHPSSNLRDLVPS